MAENYVKFLRGTPTAYNNLAVKDADTLYFVYEDKAEVGKLYLGDKLISGSVNESGVVSYLSELQDVDTTGAVQDSILGYDATTQKWVVMDINDLITVSVMIGATSETDGASGLVPAPQAGMEKFFLRADGTWATPTGDNLSIEVVNGDIKLKDFNSGYYAYIPPIKDQETGEILIESSYEYTQGFIEGLVPKTIQAESGEIYLAWFEPSGEDLEEINSKIDEISKTVDALDETLNSENGIVSQIEKKADIDSVYTKEETDVQIATAVSSADHLKRKIVEEYVDIEIYVNTYNDADQYIFMVPNTSSEDESNKYDEYIVITERGTNGELLSYSIEYVGNWSVDLSDYATLKDLENKVDKQYSTVVDEEGNESQVEWTLLSPEDQAKLKALVIGDEGGVEISGKVNADNVEGLATWITQNREIVDGLFSKENEDKLDSIENNAQVNVIDDVSEEFSINEQKVLSLNEISISKVTNLQTELDNIQSLSEVINGTEDKIGLIERVTHLENLAVWQSILE